MKNATVLDTASTRSDQNEVTWLNDDKWFFIFVKGSENFLSRRSRTFQFKIRYSMGTCRVSTRRMFFTVTSLSSVVSSASATWKACRVGRVGCRSAKISLICNSDMLASINAAKTKLIMFNRLHNPTPPCKSQRLDKSFEHSDMSSSSTMTCSTSHWRDKYISAKYSNIVGSVLIYPWIQV